MISVLLRDDINGLKAFLSCNYKDSDLEKEILPDFPKILRNSPPLVSAASYYGSVKCVAYLIREGHDLYATDKIFFIIYKGI